MNRWQWYVYILQCKDGSYYTGCTWCLSNRLEQHLSKLGSKYTSHHKIDKLVYSEVFNNLEQARQRELQIKKWVRAKKEKLISGQWHQEWDTKSSPSTTLRD